MAGDSEHAQPPRSRVPGVRVDTVWQTVVADLPSLVSPMEAYGFISIQETA